MSGRRVIKLKRNACEACYRSRVKCVYADNDRSTCVRCARQNRECIPRVVVRGRASQQMSNSADTDLNEIDLDAYRSVALFENLPHLTLHYSAAASMVRTYKSLGMTKPPTSLRWTVNVLYLLALAEKSVGLLHTASTLAVSIGMDLDFDLLNSRAAPLTEPQRQQVERSVHEKYLRDDGTLRDACFILRLDSGDRGIVANDAYEFLFERASDMVNRLQRAPHFRLWRQFVADKSACDNFCSQIVKTYLSSGPASAPEDQGPHAPPQVSWSTQASERVELRDASGNGFSAVMYEHGVMAAEGFLNLLVFGFKDIQPLDDGARARMALFRGRADSGQQGNGGEEAYTPSSSSSSSSNHHTSSGFAPGGGSMNMSSGPGSGPPPPPAEQQTQQTQTQQTQTQQQMQTLGRTHSLSRFDSLFSEMLPPPVGEDEAWQSWGAEAGHGDAGGSAEAMQVDGDAGVVVAKPPLPLRAGDIAENVRNGRAPWTDGDLARMDSREMLDALDKAFDSVGGKEVLESGEWKH